MRISFVALITLAACQPGAAAPNWAGLVQAGNAAVVPAENLACSIAQNVDPSGATAACVKIDQAGNVIGEVLTIAEDVVSVAALVKLHPATPAVAAKMFAAMPAKK